MNIFLALLRSIPDVVWSGLFAAALTLSGVFYSDWRNTRRLKFQLQHDSDEKVKERTATLRRDIYLRTAEELVKINTHLTNLPHIDVKETNLGDGFQGFNSAAACLQLVAEPKTALLVNELVTNYGELTFKLMIKLPPVIKARNDIEIAESLYSKSQAEVTRILSTMTQLNESKFPDPQTFKVLNESFDFHQSQATMYSEEGTEARKRFNNHNIAYQRYLLAELKDINLKQIPVMVEIRRDLGLTGDLAEIEAQMKQQWIRIEAHFDALIDSLTKQIS